MQFICNNDGGKCVGGVADVVELIKIQLHLGDFNVHICFPVIN